MARESGLRDFTINKIEVIYDVMSIVILLQDKVLLCMASIIFSYSRLKLS